MLEHGIIITMVLFNDAFFDGEKVVLRLREFSNPNNFGKVFSV